MKYVSYKILTVIVALAVALALLPLSLLPRSASAAVPTELFFSEYIEGSSNNKALEIFNGTGASVDLSAGQYQIEIYFNGSFSATTILLTGTVANGDVYVLADNDAVQAILDQADQTSTTSFYNGNDAVLLRKGGSSGTPLDCIGQVGVDPGSQWGTDPVSTMDNTIRRKGTVHSGAPGGSPLDLTTEWNGYDVDTFTYLGSHTISPTVWTSAATGVDATSATLNGNIIDTGGVDANKRGFSYRIKDTGDWTEWLDTGTFSTGIYSHTITGLVSATTYEFFATAENTGGKDSDPTRLEFTTLTGPPTVTTAALSSITSTTASTGGNVTSDGGVPVTARGVCWGRSPGPTTALNKTTEGTGTGSFTSSLTGLDPNSTYYVRAYATNSEGTSYGDEFRFDTSPPTPTTWYLAEGTTAWGFNCYISIQNPNNAAVSVNVTYNTEDGAVPGGTISLPAMSQTTVNPKDKLGEKDFSTLVTAPNGETIAVDRTMEWTGGGAGTGKGSSPEAHNSIGVTSPAKTWYLPEGSTSWGFETWLLIQNPNNAEATCSVTYMIEGADPVTLEKKVPANSRKSYNMASDIGEKDASIKVTSSVPVIPERAMYRNNRREGHDSIGTTSPATDFYLAEGAVGYDSGYITYVLVQNPQNEPNKVTVTYLTGSGEVAGPTIDMAPNSRKTIRVNDQLPPATDVSTRVHGEKPVIAERAMYWNSPAGEACHDSIGMDSAHKSFYLPDGQTSEGRETWTLVSNPNAIPVEVRISYLPAGGGATITFTDILLPNSRKSYNMADKLPSGRASVLVESIMGGPVMCERAMYWSSRGAGTDTIGGYSD